MRVNRPRTPAETKLIRHRLRVYGDALLMATIDAEAESGCPSATLWRLFDEARLCGVFFSRPPVPKTKHEQEEEHRLAWETTLAWIEVGRQRREAREDGEVLRDEEAVL